MTIATFVCMGVARAQDPAGVRGRWETDVNLSPRTGVMEKNGLGTFGAECAVRYRLWNRFSAGLGVSVPFMWNELDAIPLYLSGRYEVLPEQRLSPYFLLNAGASCVQQGEFVRQENGLYAYGRAALGVEYRLAGNTGLFAELGVATLGFKWFYTPLTFGIRSPYGTMEGNPHLTSRWEYDVAFSPRTEGPMDVATSFDLSVRYRMSDHFALGVSLTPTYTPVVDEENGRDPTYGFVGFPLSLSMRYESLPGQRLSPYLRLNAGAGLPALAEDYYMVRYALGVDYRLTECVSLFAEAGLMYLQAGGGNLMTPVYVGVRF